MTLQEQFAAARDITPAFGVLTVVHDGKTVQAPMLDRCDGALFIAEDQGEVIAADGSTWLVGTQNGALVKRRVR